MEGTAERELTDFEFKQNGNNDAFLKKSTLAYALGLKHLALVTGNYGYNLIS